MPYIRIKDIPRNGKKYTYAYLVRTTWRKRKHPKQASLKYLGKLYSFEKSIDLPHCLNHGLAKEEVYRELYRIELLKHGFKQQKNLLTSGECVVDLSKMFFYTLTGKEMVLQLNSGFLCSHSFSKLLSTPLNEDKKIQKNFIKQLALSGIALSSEEFLDLHTYLANGRL